MCLRFYPPFSPCALTGFDEDELEQVERLVTGASIANFCTSTMADDADVEAESQASDSKSRDMQQQSKALDSITDYAEERQLDGKKVQQVRAGFPSCAMGKVFLIQHLQQLRLYYAFSMVPPQTHPFLLPFAGDGVHRCIRGGRQGCSKSEVSMIYLYSSIHVVSLE